MGRYLLTFLGGIVEAPDDQAASAARWEAWFEENADAVVDAGDAVGAHASIDSRGRVTRNQNREDLFISGYAIVASLDLDDAIDIAASCPILGEGGRVEVGELLRLTGDDDEADDEADEVDELFEDVGELTLEDVARTGLALA